MEKAPGQEQVEMTPEQIRERIGQIDRAIITLKDNLNRIPGETQESSQGDDDAVETEMMEPRFGEVSQEIQDLERERKELEDKLHQLA